MHSLLPRVLTISFFFVLSLLLITNIPNAKAATASHVVISEVQINGIATTDDFIEFYNPTASTVNLNGMRLVKRTSSGATDSGIIIFNATHTIASHGYFLWCNSVNLSNTLSCNASSAATITTNNSVALRNGPANTGTIVDAITLGTVSFPLGEGTAIGTTLGANESVERKANSFSTSTTMAIGGIDELLGNGEDTDNNANDFALRNTPQPQNSLSAIEPVPTQTPTASPTPTDVPTSTPTTAPSPTVTPTNTPTDNPTPTEIPTPTDSPTPTPTTAPSPTPTPTNSPTPSPTITPTPTNTPTSTPTSAPTPTEIVTPTSIPTTTLTPSPTIQITLTPAPTAITPTPTTTFPKFNLVCTQKMLTFKILAMQFSVPLVSCKLVRQ